MNASARLHLVKPSVEDLARAEKDQLAQDLAVFQRLFLSPAHATFVSKNGKEKSWEGNERVLRLIFQDIGPLWSPEKWELRMLRRSATVKSSTLRGEQHIAYSFIDRISDPRYSQRELFLKMYGAYPIRPTVPESMRRHLVDDESEGDTRPVSGPELLQVLSYLADAIEHAITKRERRILQRDRNMIMFQVAYGLRVMEVATARLSSFAAFGAYEFYRDFASVRVTGKSSKFGAAKVRTVYSVPEFSGIADVMEAHRDFVMPQFRGGDNDLLFTEENGEPLEPHYISKRFTINARRAQLPSACEAHGLRRHYATRLALNDNDIWFVSQQLGHSSIATTLNYIYIGDDDRRRMILQAQKEMLAAAQLRTELPTPNADQGSLR